MKRFIFISIMVTLLLACFQISYAGTFYDILDTKYEGIVESLAFLKIVDGVSDNIYDANKIVTRAELSKMLVIAHGYEETSSLLDAPKAFNDVKEGAWYYDYVNIAAAYGLLKGYPDGNFYPDREVSYAEAVAMILRSLGHNYIREDSEFGWEFNYIQKMRELKLNEGMEVFSNQDGAKRGEVAVLIWNMLKQNKWEIIEEEGTGVLTYTDSGKVLLDTAFENEYELVSGKKLKSLSALDKKMYAEVEGYGEVELKSTLPFYAIGSKITGVYQTKDKVLSCAVYDTDIAFIDGAVDELEKEGYRIKGVKDKYYFGGKNDDDYAFFAIKRESGLETIDRVLIFDFDGKIVVDSIKNSSKKIVINNDIEINEENALLMDGKKIVEWKDLKVDGEILPVGENLYVVAKQYKTEEDIKDEKRQENKNDTLYYVSSISYINDKAYIDVVSAENKKHYECVKALSDIEVGQFVIITLEDGKVTKCTAASEKEYEKLKTNKELILDYKNQNYIPGKFGMYTIDEDTQIYIVNKKYKNNSDTVIEKCTLESIKESELQYIDSEKVNILISGNNAKIIYIERESNKFSVFYARVREVIQDKEKIKLALAPIDEAIKTVEAEGKIECDTGDIISYTTTKKDTTKKDDKSKGNDVIKIDEVYHTSFIGYKGDLIVDSASNKQVTLTNGDMFNQEDSAIRINGKVYKLSDYIIIQAKVRKSEDGWVFSSTSFAEMNKMKLAEGDRIAIDELEGVIVIYSGYTD